MANGSPIPLMALAKRAEASRVSSSTVLSAPAHRLVGGFRQVEQDHHRQVAPVDDIAHGDARIGLHADPAHDDGIDSGIDVELVAVLQPPLPGDPLRPQTVDDLPDPVADALMGGQDSIDRLRIAASLSALIDGGPARTAQLDLVSPIRRSGTDRRQAPCLPCRYRKRLRLRMERARKTVPRLPGHRLRRFPHPPR